MKHGTMVATLVVDDVLKLHGKLVEHFSGTADPIEPPGVKDGNLLASALSRSQTSLGHVEKYRLLEEKAAAMFHSLVKNHAFHNGNKRTALVSMLAFLDRNDRRLKTDVADDEVFEMVIGIASDSFPAAEFAQTPDAIVSALADWLRVRIASKKARSSTMRTRDFVESCVKAGLRVKEDGLGWKVIGKHGVVKIPEAKREITGSVMRIYLQNLGLSEAETGISIDEFQEGVSSENAILHRYHSVLKRLAHV